MCPRKTNQFLNFVKCKAQWQVPVTCNFVARFRISAVFNTKKGKKMTKATFLKCSQYHQDIYNTVNGSYRNILKPFADIDSSRTLLRSKFKCLDVHQRSDTGTDFLVKY